MLAARLEIHVINVSQGDAVLVIDRDVDAVAALFTSKGAALPQDPLDYAPTAVLNGWDMFSTVRAALLIDGGGDAYGGDVVDYVRAQGALPSDPGSGAPAVFADKLSIMISHLHADHAFGVRSVFTLHETEAEASGSKVTVKRKFRQRFIPRKVHMPEDNSRTDRTREVYLTQLLDELAAAQSASRPMTVHTYGLGGWGDSVPPGFELGGPIDGTPAIKVHILAAGQYVWDQSNPVLVQGKTKFDPNDRSIVAMIEYGSFRFFTGGDIAGDGGVNGGNAPNPAASGKRWFSSTHADVESVLRPALLTRFPKTAQPKKGDAKFPCAGTCSVMKVSHHGSDSSTDTYLLSALQPTIAVTSCGYRAAYYGHPTKAVIGRLTPGTSPNWGVPGNAELVSNTVKARYYTEIVDKYGGSKKPLPGPTGANDFIVGDVVIRPTDDSVVAVQNATDFGATLTIHVYWSGVQTQPDPDERTTLRPVLTGATTAAYPCGSHTYTEVH